MKRHFALLACLAIFPTALAAQTDSNELTGRPPGAAKLQGHNSVGFPAPVMKEGQPIETRTPEKADDKPVFAGQTRAPFHATTPPHVAILTDKLSMPWSLAFLPDGKMLITEKNPAALRIVDAQGTLSAPLSGLPPINAGGQVGLLDVALDAHFAANKRIFFSYSEPVGANDSNIAIASATLDEAGGAIHDVKVIFRAQPAAPKSVAANEGGRIAIAADGTLYATIGDRSGSPPWLMAQKMNIDLGKIIHITPDGAAVPGNPFEKVPGARPEVWSIGHRSEEGLAFDGKGRLWETEHGPRGGDELNLIAPGKNYGWPLVTHGLDYPGEAIGSGAVDNAGTVQPRYYWDPVIAPSGLAFYNGSAFPQWKNSVFVGALRGQFLDRLTLSGDKVVAEEPLLVDLHNRVRDVRVGPDDAIYVLTDEGRLVKLTPK